MTQEQSARLPATHGHTDRAEVEEARRALLGQTDRTVVRGAALVIVSSYHYLTGPLVAVGALGVIILICRWVFAPPRQRTAAPPAPTRGGDYGLLVPIATVRTDADAEMLRSLLREAGIRCTVAADAEGADVLVFRTDALRARDLVRS